MTESSYQGEVPTGEGGASLIEMVNVDREQFDVAADTASDGGGWSTLTLSNVTKDHIHTVVNDGPGSLEIGLGQNSDDFTLEPGESKDFRYKGELHVQAETGSGDAAYRYICEGN